jgi:predicted amidophosphoribosyltransferase
MKVANNTRICSVCGSRFSAGLKFCPVCMLSMGFKGESDSEQSSPQVVRSDSASQAASQRFEHYELLVSEDGKPIELGRGAMG